MSRFFSLPARLYNALPFWAFLRVLYKTWVALKSKEDQAQQETEAEAAAPGPDAVQGPGQRGRKPDVDLLKDLRKMQEKRRTLDIVCDILRDPRVKFCGWMHLGTVG